MTMLVHLLFLVIGVDLAAADYWSTRDAFIEKDQHSAVGATLLLTSKEESVNEKLMKYKCDEIDRGFINPEEFLAGQHFFKSKAGIEKSEVFEILKRLPKGASLHSHDMALVSEEYLFSLTYKNDLYACIVDGKLLRLHFFDKNSIGTDCQWELVSELRAKKTDIDDVIKSEISLVVENPEEVYPNINSIWKSFQTIFTVIIGVLCYKPVWQEYLYQALKELHEDNVKYIELRGVLPEVYDLNGTKYGPVEVVGLYQETLQQFKKDYLDFHGARFIYAPSRKVDNKTMDQYVDTFLELREKYPDFIAGFDLVGQEDLGRPLEYFIPQLLELTNLGVKFFFHAGETNWNGLPTDNNLFDAILLNTTRIGHGYAILKHPTISKIVKHRKIAIEISPISNQVLKLVDDIRNHPGAILIADNYPVVITPDDPSFWGAKALSYDWYYAFMALASREADLRFLKQLAINSLVYSAMEGEELNSAMDQWQDDWDTFIDSFDDFMKEGFNVIPKSNK